PTKKELEQWFFKITAYAQRLLDDLNKLDRWPERVKLMQANWIGRSEGADLDFFVERDGELRVVTTRPDNVLGANVMVVALEFEYGRQHKLPIRRVISVSHDAAHEPLDAAFEAYEGVLVNSGSFNGLSVKEGIERITAEAERKRIGQRTITYRLRDWLISRQRYWGVPIPIIYCPDHGIVPVPDDQLPVPLPAEVEFRSDGQNPLAHTPSFVNTTCPKCGKPSRRETDTMDTFVDSSWYFLRYTSGNDPSQPFDKKRVDYWMPVDQYTGGIEHAILHLLYS